MAAKTAAVFVLVFMTSFTLGAASSSSAEVIYTAKLVLEDGRPFPAVPLALPPLTGSSCSVHSIGLDGKILYSGPPAEYVPADQSYTRESRVTDRCLAAFLIKGYGKVASRFTRGCSHSEAQWRGRRRFGGINRHIAGSPGGPESLGEGALRPWTTRNGRGRRKNSGGR